MRETTKAKLRLIAPELILGHNPKPCPITIQRAIAILEILKDGNWHTSKDIGDRLNLGEKYVKEILMVCKQSWELQAIRGNNGGWKLNGKH